MTLADIYQTYDFIIDNFELKTQLTDFCDIDTITF